MQDPALLESVNELVTLASDGINAALAELPSEANDDDLTIAIQTCQSNVETIAMAADMAQLTGLQQLCEAVSDALSEHHNSSQAFQTDVGPRLIDWSQAVQRYLQHANVSEITESLFESLLALAPARQHNTLRLELVGGPEVVPEPTEPVCATNDDNTLTPSPSTASATSEQQTLSSANEEYSAQTETDTIDSNETVCGPDEPDREDEHTADILEQTASDGAASDGAASDGAASDGAASDGAASDGAASDGEDSVAELSSLTPVVSEPDSADDLTDDAFASAASAQLDEIFAELAPWQIILQTATASDTEVQTACSHYGQITERIQAVGMALGLTGLGITCEVLAQNIQALASAELTTRTAAADLLADWPGIIKQYLDNPEDEQHQLALLELLLDTRWPTPLPEEQGEALFAALSPDEEEYLADLEQRPTIAQAEDVALRIDPDVNPKLVEVFLQESPHNAADFSAAVERITRGEEILKNLGAAQRLAHNIKGSANLIGVKGVANIAHHSEDILEYLVEHQSPPQAALARTLQEAADCIEAMLESIQTDMAAPPEAQQVLQAIFDWANRMDAGELTTPVADPVTTSVAEPADRPSEEPTTVAATATVEPETTQSPRNTNTPAETPPTTAPVAVGKVVRVPTETIDTMFRLVGEVSIAVDQLQERFETVRRFGNEIRNHDNFVQQRRFELENFIDVRHVANTQQRLRQLSHGQDFDPLEMDQYDELYSTTRSFIESVVDSRRLSQNMRSEFADLERALAPLQRMKDDLQLAVMNTRMEPVSTISARLQRSVRQAARATDKQVELYIEGSDIQLDSEVLDRLAEPLMHMLRNAVDHGIEAPAERINKDKPETGSITLRFSQQGQSVVIECIDDGRGLDYAQIRTTAIGKGLLSDNANINHAELARLIMAAGFSTRSSATQISGRGVGMDVVQTAIRELKGVIEIGDSKATGGCHISLRLPITLLTSHSLVVQLGNQRYAIPTSAIMQVISPRHGRFTQVGKQLAYEIGQDAYPATTLNTCLGYSSDGNMPAADSAVVMIYSDTGPIAVAVDQFINSYDLVVKSLGRFVGKVHGITGLSSLADGSLIPVLDVAELLRTPVQTVTTMTSAADTNDHTQQPVTANRIMIVDDSISVRQTLTDLIEDAGYQAIVARDGIEAVDLLRQQAPQLVLSDIEMPRMNGLELVSYIRNTYGNDLPVIMITSRTMQKHRQQAATAGANGYVTKPFDEEELLTQIRALLQ